MEQTVLTLHGIISIAFSNICYQVVTTAKDNGWRAVDGTSGAVIGMQTAQILFQHGTVPVNYVAIGK